jgi:cytochrome d ubiquinol oxidase subunit II
MDLVLIWFGLAAIVMALYVILDGFGLGVALLFPAARNERERDVMVNSIAPVWDANQTFLVFGGAALFAAFPMIYTVLLSALYIPIITFVFGLIFRGVTFEFRANAVHKRKWDISFFSGSLVAVVAQGLTLGGYLTGIHVASGHFAGGPFDWFNPFSVMVGLALVAGYSLLGATYLIIKTGGSVQERSYRQAHRAVWIVLGFIIVVTIWSPFHDASVLSRWLSAPRIYFICAFPVLQILSFIALMKSLRSRREILPFFWSVVLVIMAYLGLLSSIYPYAIPPCISLHEAASQAKTLSFLLWFVAIILPVVLGYVLYNYLVFRGKVDAAEGKGY